MDSTEFLNLSIDSTIYSSKPLFSDDIGWIIGIFLSLGVQIMSVGLPYEKFFMRLFHTWTQQLWQMQTFGLIDAISSVMGEI